MDAGRSPLRRHALQGDADLRLLRDFLQSENQFQDDARWHGGTALKAVWLSMFEFLNHQPTTEYWTDGEAVAAVLVAWPGRWRVQPGRRWRERHQLQLFASRGHQLANMLAEDDSMVTTHAYGERNDVAEGLAALGYAQGAATEVFMACDPRTIPAPPALAAGYQIGEIDSAKAAHRTARAIVQGDAFGGGNPDGDIVAWQVRNTERTHLYTPNGFELYASTGEEPWAAFASFQYDLNHRIAEVEPVGTRTDEQGKGLARTLVATGLKRLGALGVETAHIRTDTDNLAAIRAYEAAGFVIRDQLYAWTAPQTPSA